MRIDDITDRDLRDWVDRHVEETISELKSRKRSADDTLSIWRSFNQEDWHAFREIMTLRPRALAQFQPAEIDRAIQDISCDRYTLGKEAKALRALLKAPGPEKMTAAKVTELFITERDLPDPFH